MAYSLPSLMKGLVMKMEIPLMGIFLIFLGACDMRDNTKLTFEQEKLEKFERCFITAANNARRSSDLIISSVANKGEGTHAWTLRKDMTDEQKEALAHAYKVEKEERKEEEDRCVRLYK